MDDYGCVRLTLGLSVVVEHCGVGYASPAGPSRSDNAIVSYAVASAPSTDRQAYCQGLRCCYSDCGGEVEPLDEVQRVEGAGDVRGVEAAADAQDEVPGEAQEPSQAGTTRRTPARVVPLEPPNGVTKELLAHGRPVSGRVEVTQRHEVGNEVKHVVDEAAVERRTATAGQLPVVAQRRNAVDFASFEANYGRTKVVTRLVGASASPVPVGKA